MRPWTFFSVILFVHVLALAGLIAYLHASDRLNRDRAEAVVDMFRMTIDEEKAYREEQAKLDANAAAQAAEDAYWVAVADGPRQVEASLAEEVQATESRRQALERQERALKDLAAQLARDKQALALEAKRLEDARAEFDDAMDARLERLQDEDFQVAVRMYENVKAKQAKEMFQELMRTGRTEHVVDYLAAMQQRKAAAVLKEFKQPVEIIQATQLIEKLRTRGVDLMPDGFQEDPTP